jgi:hypothetical protein
MAIANGTKPSGKEGKRNTPGGMNSMFWIFPQLTWNAKYAGSCFKKGGITDESIEFV